MIIESKEGVIKVSIVNEKVVIKTNSDNVLLFSEEFYLMEDNKIKSSYNIPLFTKKGLLLGVSLEIKSGSIFIVYNEELFNNNKDKLEFYIGKVYTDVVYDKNGGIYEMV